MNKNIKFILWVILAIVLIKLLWPFISSILIVAIGAFGGFAFYKWIESLFKNGKLM